MMMKKSYSRQEPQRTCVVCHQKADKRTLIRLVRIENGVVEVDLTGRKNGRGAYMCPSLGCWQDGIKKGQLERALKVGLDRENRQSLIQYGNSLKIRE